MAHSFQGLIGIYVYPMNLAAIAEKNRRKSRRWSVWHYHCGHPLQCTAVKCAAQRTETESESAKAHMHNWELWIWKGIESKWKNVTSKNTCMVWPSFSSDPGLDCLRYADIFEHAAEWQFAGVRLPAGDCFKIWTRVIVVLSSSAKPTHTLTHTSHRQQNEFVGSSAKDAVSSEISWRAEFDGEREQSVFNYAYVRAYDGECECVFRRRKIEMQTATIFFFGVWHVCIEATLRPSPL